MHICVSKRTIIGSDDGLSPGWCQAIIRTKIGILFIRTLGSNFREILSEIHTFSFKKMHFKLPSVKWRQFCLGPYVLIDGPVYILDACINIVSADALGPFGTGTRSFADTILYFLSQIDYKPMVPDYHQNYILLETLGKGESWLGRCWVYVISIWYFTFKTSCLLILKC